MARPAKLAKYILSVAALLALIVAGSILPGALSLGRDSTILGKVQSEQLDEAELAEYINVSMVEKVGMLGQASGTLLVPLNAGAMYSQDSIRDKYFEEMDKLCALRFFPMVQRDTLDSFRAAATLYIQYDEPAISTIVWEVSIRTEGAEGVFCLDDQTGKILSFAYEGDKGDGLAYQEGMVREWAAYLGAEVRNIKGRSREDVQGESTDEAVYDFALTSGSRLVNGLMGSSIAAEGEGMSRWSLQYAQSQNGQALLTQ
ncbi:MAG: hypothetical protein FWF83_00060 [Clostridiales bacterium]|nr:hypothetical protein [Clostridiales bacterium]